MHATAFIAREIRRTSPVPVVAFVSDRAPGLSAAVATALREGGLTVIPGPADTVAAYAARDERVYFDGPDGHWNDRGHALIARALYPILHARLAAERPGMPVRRVGP